jgi:hypothetical protein
MAEPVESRIGLYLVYTTWLPSGERRGCSAVIPSSRTSTSVTVPLARSSRSTPKVVGGAPDGAFASNPK